MSGHPAGRITITGLGIVGIEHLTAQAEAAIRRSHTVLFLDTGIATEDYLAARCPAVIDLSVHYLPGRPRLAAYEQMAADVIDAALDGGEVTFAIQGHPLTFAYPAFLVRDMAEVLGIDVVIHPGISALDTILVTLGVEPGLHGLLQHEATDLLLRRRPIPADVPLLLWQVGNLGDLATSETSVAADVFGILRDHLMCFHPADHVVTAVYCAPHPLMDDVVLPVRLEDLPTLAPMLHPGFSLFVPASEWRPIVDLGLLRRITPG